MSFYVRRWPGPCDPRDGPMGHVELNGIQTPPARIWFEDRGPPTVISNWTYDGPLGPLTALPELIVPLITPDCEPRFVVWELITTVMIGGLPQDFEIRIEKRDRSIFTVDDWDSYWIQLTINAVASNDFIEHRQLSDVDYSRYQNNTPGLPWKWGPPLVPTQTVSWTEAWPIAWDRTSPGPPFIPGL